MMENTQIHSDEKIKERQVEKQFLTLLADDIDSGNVKAIPSDVVERVAAIKHKALVAKSFKKSEADER